MIRRFAFLFLFLGCLALAFEQANPLLLYPFDATEEAPSPTHLPKAEVHELEGPDGRIVAWLAPPKPGKPMVMYFHGNAGNLADRTGRFQRFQRAGFGIFALGYPGSSGSEGHATERTIIASAQIAYDWLLERPEARQASHILFYGESLGSAVAIALLADLKTQAGRPIPNSVVLEAPFTSVKDVAEHMAGALGQAASVVLDDWPSWQRAARALDIPTIVLHGHRDEVIPVSHGRAIYEVAPSSKKDFLVARQANHVNYWSKGDITRVLGHMALKDLGL